MKTVMIPNTHTMWEATINKKHYAYPGGTMQTVPDEVAALIEDITRAFPEPTPERVKAPFELSGGVPPTPGGNVPDPEVADIGKVLGIVEDGSGAKYAPVEGSGSGLPDPSELADGTAAVVVNGEWKMQDGYGYTGDPAFEPITWDGNTEGRESINEGAFFKVAEELDITALDGSVATLSGAESAELLFVSTEEIMPNYYSALYGVEIIIVILTDDVDVGEGIIFPKGGYFPKSDFYVSSLTAAPSVHQFDPALIPGVVPAAPSEDGAYVLTCTITNGEAVYSWETTDEVAE